MKQDNCIFCKIIAGEIPSQAIYEDEKFRVILDVAPAAKGDALILPKTIMQTFMGFPMIWQQTLSGWQKR